MSIHSVVFCSKTLLHLYLQIWRLDSSYKSRTFPAIRLISSNIDYHFQSERSERLRIINYNGGIVVQWQRCRTHNQRIVGSIPGPGHSRGLSITGWWVHSHDVVPLSKALYFSLLHVCMYVCMCMYYARPLWKEAYTYQGYRVKIKIIIIIIIIIITSWLPPQVAVSFDGYDFGWKIREAYV